MLVTIQTTIPGIPYSINKQEFDTTGMTAEQIQANLTVAKTISNMVVTEYGEQSPGEVQLAEENKQIKLLNEKLGVDSERKSVMINAMKEALGEEKFNELRDKVVESMDYKKITIHTSLN